MLKLSLAWPVRSDSCVFSASRRPGSSCPWPSPGSPGSCGWWVVFRAQGLPLEDGDGVAASRVSERKELENKWIPPTPIQHRRLHSSFIRFNICHSLPTVRKRTLISFNIFTSFTDPLGVTTSLPLPLPISLQMPFSSCLALAPSLQPLLSMPSLLPSSLSTYSTGMPSHSPLCAALFTIKITNHHCSLPFPEPVFFQRYSILCIGIIYE